NLHMEETPDRKQPPEGRRWCNGTAKTTGKPCGNYAIPGGTVCFRHGGAVTNTRNAALARVIEAEAAKRVGKFGGRVDVSPQQALLDEVSRSAHTIRFYESQIEALGVDVTPGGLVWGHVQKKETNGPEGYRSVSVEEARINVWLKLWNEERDRLVRVSKA